MRWIARYEDGFMTNDGERCAVTDTLHVEHPWTSPDEALSHWAFVGDLNRPSVQRYGNGLMQVDDVSADPRFAELGVAAIWRRVTFQRS